MIDTDKLNWTVKGHVEKWSADQIAAAGLADDASSAELRAAGIEPSELVPFEGNLLLNEGIAEMWDLIIAAGGTTAYNNANARLGVGNSATAAAATDTDLLGASKLYKAMNATFPSRASETVTFEADFTTGEANFAWQEWSIDNGATPLKNMNRKVTSLGTKVSGTWTLTVTITLS